MTMLEAIFIAGISTSIVAFFLSLAQIIHWLLINRKIKVLRAKSAMKKKRKKLKQQYHFFLIKRKTAFRNFLLFLLMSCLLLAGGVLSRYYQAMHLSKKDEQAVVKGYYLLQDFEDQLFIAKEEAEEEVKIQNNIRYLATALSGYGIQKSNPVNSQEGQLILNRYYQALTELGMNVSVKTNELYGNAELVDEFLMDVKKTKTYEQKAFEYYKVDDDALKEK